MIPLESIHLFAQFKWNFTYSSLALICFLFASFAAQLAQIYLNNGTKLDAAFALHNINSSQPDMLTL